MNENSGIRIQELGMEEIELEYEKRVHKIANDLGFCLCGNFEEVLIYIRDFLKKIEDRKFDSHEDMNYIFFCHWADKNKYVEHGTTIRRPWLTVKGKSLVGMLNKLNLED